jgi:hypothetical protein
MKFFDFYLMIVIAALLLANNPARAQMQPAAADSVEFLTKTSDTTKKSREEYWLSGPNNSIYYQNGFVGIGTSNPASSLHVQGNMKMGSNIGTVGTNAFAGGDRSIATGINAFGFGIENEAVGNASFATGNKSKARGNYSVAMGRSCFTQGENAIALGYVAEARAANSVAVGRHLSAGASSAIVLGNGLGLNENMLINAIPYSLMIGFNSTVPTFFVGSSDGAGTTGSIGIGNIGISNMTDPQAKLHMLSDEDEAATLKLEHRTTGTNRYAEISLGTHRIRAGNTENMVFSTPDTNRHFVFENGNVGIATSNPGASLHVQGNMKMGSNIGAVGTNAFAGGDGSTASGTNAFAFGDEAKALNTGAFASGLRAEASGRHSTAFGRGSKATNENAIALGYVAEASTPNAIVIGKHARVVAGNSYIIGSGLGLGSDMLENNVGYSIMIGMKSNLPTFFVGSSDGAGTTGKIGIGNMTAPQAKLHMLSDEDEAATLKLEHRTTGTNRYAEIGLGTHSIRAGNTENMVFSTPEGNRHFVFENGNIGVGTASPTSALQIHRDEEPEFKLSNNQGDLIMAVVNTPWHYAPTSQEGDVVFKTHYNGNRHGMIFNLNDDLNDGNSYIKFNDNHNHHTLTILNNGNTGFGTDKPQTRIHLEDGDIYLSDIQSGIIMKSPDGQCWRGRLNEQGALVFTSIDCPDEEASSQPELLGNKLMTLAPNPTTGRLLITHTLAEGITEVRVYDLGGTMLFQKQFNSTTINLNLEHLAAGTYVVSLKKQNKVVATDKFVKN